MRSTGFRGKAGRRKRRGVTTRTHRDQINHGNVHELDLRWKRSVDAASPDAPPVVHQGVLYLLTPDDRLHALEATKGELLWTYALADDDPTGGAFISDTPGDGDPNLAIYGKQIIGTTSNHIFAFDTQAGELAWKAYLDAESTGPGTRASGPMIGGGLAYAVGRCEARAQLRGCAISAHDVMTGDKVWQKSLIPEPSDSGDEDWSQLREIAQRYGASGTGPTYDPDRGLLYVGARIDSPPSRTSGWETIGSSRQLGGTMALDAGSGALIWHHVHRGGNGRVAPAPAPLLIEAAVGPTPLLEASISPGTERGWIHAMVPGDTDPTGLLYMLDRQTGSVVWSREVGGAFPTSNTPTWAGAGRAVAGPRASCPDAAREPFADAWSYNPQTYILFTAMGTDCARTYDPAFGQRHPGAPVQAAAGVPATREIRGNMLAISAETGEIGWSVDHSEVPTGLLSTNGGLVFLADAAGTLQVFDDRDGDLLWSRDLGSPTVGSPITYAVDRRQYVAVTTTGQATPDRDRPARSSGYNLFVFAVDRPPADDFERRAVNACLAGWQDALENENHARYVEYLDDAARASPFYASEQAMKFWARQMRGLADNGFAGEFRLIRINVAAPRAPVGAYRAYPVLADGRQLEDAIVISVHDDTKCRILQLFS